MCWVAVYWMWQYVYDKEVVVDAYLQSVFSGKCWYLFLNIFFLKFLSKKKKIKFFRLLIEKCWKLMQIVTLKFL